MELQVNRWGNSLAVRLPAQLARQMGLEEGSQAWRSSLLKVSSSCRRARRCGRQPPGLSCWGR